MRAPCHSAQPAKSMSSARPVIYISAQITIALWTVKAAKFDIAVTADAAIDANFAERRAMRIAFVTRESLLPRKESSCSF